MQYVRARIIWSNEPALAVPVVAVNRIAGQYFVFVAEPRRRAFVARQKPVTLGEVIGEDYVVRGGLQAGRARHRLQRSEDRRRRAGQARASGHTANHVRRHVHPAADPRERLLARHRAGRRAGDPDDADRLVSGGGAADGVGHRDLYRRQRRDGRDGGHDAARAGDQRRRGHALHVLVEHQQRRQPDHRDLRRHARSGHRRRRRAEPRQPGDRPAARPKSGSSASPSRRSARTSSRPARVYSETRRVRRALRLELHRRLRQGRAEARPRRRRRRSLRRAQVTRCASGSIRSVWPRASSPPATSSTRCASRTSTSPPAASATRRPARDRRTRSACAPPGACARAQRVRERHRQDRRATATLVRLGDVGSVELGAETYSSLLRFQGVDAVGFGVLALPTANALDVQRGVVGGDGPAARSRFRRARSTEHRLRHDHRRAGVDRRGRRDAADRRSASSSW